MGKLIYAAICSLDGYVNDENGAFDWSAPDEQVHAFVNDLERGIGTYLYGRRLYEVMVFWETLDAAGQSPASVDYADIWRAAQKVVFSRSLDAPRSARTRIEREFDPDTVRRWKAESEHDLSVGGPELASAALRAGLVDECHLFLNPIVIGGGTPALPSHLRIALQLLDERRFASGVVHLHYRLQ
jgi:dihydrofolate reductase